MSRGKTTYCASHGGAGAKCRVAGCNAVVHGNLKVCQAHLDLSDNPPTNGDIKGEEEPDIDWYEPHELP